MFAYKLFLLFAVLNHEAYGSLMDELQEAINHVKNETAEVALSNAELEKEIQDQANQFKSDMAQLKGLDISEELANITAQVSDVLLKVKFLYTAKDTLNNVSIPEKKLNLLKVQYGLKWMKEDFSILEKRSSDGDQDKCLRILEEQSEEDNVTMVVQQRVLMAIDPYEDEIEVAKLELSQLMMALKVAQRAHNQLHLKLVSDKAVFAETLANAKLFIEDVEKNVEKAKTLLAKFEEEFASLTAEVNELKKEFDDLDKEVKELTAEAVKVKSDINTYTTAILCYAKYQHFSAGDDE